MCFEIFNVYVLFWSRLKLCALVLNFFLQNLDFFFAIVIFFFFFFFFKYFRYEISLSSKKMLPPEL